MKWVALMAVALAGCAHSPRVSTSLIVKRKSSDMISVIVAVKNLEDRATTPILVNVTAELREGDRWTRPQAVLQPAAFVLNRGEEHSVDADVRTQATAIRTTLVVKEAETGKLLKTEKSVPPIQAEARK